jgi:hypothetical protein
MPENIKLSSLACLSSDPERVQCPWRRLGQSNKRDLFRQTKTEKAKAQKERSKKWIEGV